MSALSACRVSYSGCRLGPVTGIDWRTSSRICRARWRWTLSKKFIKQVLLEAKTLRKLTTLITDGRMDCETNARMDRVICNNKNTGTIYTLIGRTLWEDSFLLSKDPILMLIEEPNCNQFCRRPLSSTESPWLISGCNLVPSPSRMTFYERGFFSVVVLMAVCEGKCHFQGQSGLYMSITNPTLASWLVHNP